MGQSKRVWEEMREVETAESLRYRGEEVLNMFSMSLCTQSKKLRNENEALKAENKELKQKLASKNLSEYRVSDTTST
jgi:cell division protein FtsB